MEKLKVLLWSALVASMLMLAGIGGMDRELAEWIRDSGLEGESTVVTIRQLLDGIMGLTTSIYIPGAPLAVTGMALLAWRSRRRLGCNFLFIGAVQIAALLVGAWCKDLFGRLRPYEVLQSGAWEATWFAGGTSFPSGHAAYYFGLFLPLVYLAPRQCRLLLVFPVFVAASRIVENMHFLSDVVASIVLVLLLTAGASRLVEREGGNGKAETGIPGPAG